MAGLDAVTQYDAWQPWLQAWVRGNHVRTVAGLAAAGLLGRGHDRTLGVFSRS